MNLPKHPRYPRFDHELLGSSFAQAAETAEPQEPTPEALLYELGGTSTVWMNGTAAYHVRILGKPGVVGTLTLSPKDAETLANLFDIQRMRWQQ